MNLIRKSREGFSLIEVIVAVAILAIIALPILYYFTDAAIHAAKGKHEQEADMAAQSVIEELGSVDDFEGVEEYLPQTGKGWSVVGTPSPDANQDTSVTELEKNGIDVDGITFNAKVTVDYSDYKDAKVNNAGKPIVQYNSFDNPHFSELHSDSSVVISEAEQVNTGAYSLFYQLNGSKMANDSPDAGAVDNPSVPLNDIKNKMKRTFVLQVEDDASSPDILRVRGLYRFKYDKSSDPLTPNYIYSDALIEDTKVEKAKFDSVYFMFKAMPGGAAVGSEDAEISIADAEVAKRLKVSFFCQKQKIYNELGVETGEGDNLPATGYSINLLPTGSNFANVKFFTSGELNHIKVVNSVESKNFSDFVDKANDKRIAKITVQVYRADDNSKEILATNTTSKSI